MRYHLRFNNFHRSTLAATKTLIRGWGDSTEEQRWQKMNVWLDDVSRVYGMIRPTLGKTASHSGCYYINLNKIEIPHASVVTLLHEFRHAMQRQRVGRACEARDVEDDARAWSLSLYWKVAPRALTRLVNEGRVLHTTPSDFQ